MGGEKLQFQAEKEFNVVLDLETAKWLVMTYREAYPEVKSLWYGLDEAAVNTVKTGQPHEYSCIRYEMVYDNAGTWLACVLPNGRRIWYYDPVVESVTMPWGTKKDQLTYMGRDNKIGGAWGRIRTYGGMLTENVVQAISRDLMVEGMIRVEQAGYPIILTIHDEIVAELDNGVGTRHEFERLMAGPTPTWAAGCPVEVEGWEGPRYRKA
jgi:DNA polymerase